MELVDNFVQFSVTLLGFCLSGMRYLKGRKQAYFLLTCFYGCFALGSLYWTLYLLLFSETPQVFYVSEFGWMASVAPKEFLGHFTVFALACVVGYYVVWNVSHALHTPLMSVTNAISGIIVVGALLQIGQGGWVSFLSFIAVLIASINIFGGFTVTQRMLKMFRKN